MPPRVFPGWPWTSAMGPGPPQAPWAGCDSQTPVPASLHPGEGRAGCTPCRDTAVPEWRSVPVAAGRGQGSESLAPILPWCGDDARLHLRGTRSHGRRWFPGLPAPLLPARTSPQAGDARRRPRARWLWKTLLLSLRCSTKTASRPSGVPSRSRLSLRTCRPRILLDGSTRRGGGPCRGGALVTRWAPRRAFGSALIRALLDRRPMRLSRVPVFSLDPHDLVCDPAGLCPVSPIATEPIRRSSGLKLSAVPTPKDQAS
jgi:hypothetical protein